jgi:4-amino-4-deoxy-L-arabinose transferase-like glycosyltransferase
MGGAPRAACDNPARLHHDRTATVHAVRHTLSARAPGMINTRSLLVAVLCAAWILPGLVGHDPWKPDEAYTFGVVHEIMKGGSWIVPALAGEVFLSDPPLFHLTAAAAAWTLAPLLPAHDAARLVTGIYMALTFLFCALAGRELNGGRHGAVAALLLLGCFGLVLRGHQLITDAAALSGFAAVYYGLALALRRAAAGGFWAGAGIGLVFMTQGLLEAAAAALLAMVLPVFAAWRTRRHAVALAVAALSAAPWLLIWPALLYQHSPELFGLWLWQENIARLQGDILAGMLYYLRLLPWYAWPVWPVALWALWSARQGGLAQPALALPWAGFVVTLAVIGAATETRELYALPLLVPLALLATPVADKLRRGAANAWYWFSAMGFTFFVIVAWVYWSGLELGMPARLHAHLLRLQPDYEPGFRLLPFALGAAYTLLWIAALVTVRRSGVRPVVVWAAGCTTLWALAATLFIGWVDTSKSYRATAASLRQALPKKYDCISSMGLGHSQRAMLHYHAGIITWREEVESRRRRCTLMLVQGHPRLETPPPGAWKKIWEGSRPRDRDEIFRLYQRK